MKIAILLALALAACTSDDARDPHAWVPQGDGFDVALACVETSLAGAPVDGQCLTSSPWGTEHECPAYSWEGERGCCIEGPPVSPGSANVAIYWLPCDE